MPMRSPSASGRRARLAVLLSLALLSCGAPAAGGDGGEAPLDAGAPDAAGPEVDAGPGDAGASDGGPRDAGSGDAGPDAGGAPDAGPRRLAVFVGSGNGTISAFAFDARDGGLSLLGVTNAGSSPSFLAPDVPRRRLYAVNEGTAQVAAFALEPADAGLSLLNRAATGGNGPAHVTVDGTGRFVLVANYGGGSASVVRVTDAGVGAASDTEASGGQAHQVVLDAANARAWVPCKAADHVAQYAFDAAAGTLTPLSPPALTTATGAGPRHLALHPTRPFAYLLNELSNTVQTLAVDGSGRLSSLQTLSTLPAGFSGASTSAEVAVHPGGEFVFTSNRGHDSLARFRVSASDGTLTLLGHTPTGGQRPRHFSLDASGRWLLVANQLSGTLHLFSVDASTGALTALGLAATVASPAYAGFVELP